jgi:hypothetical protein
MNNMDDAKEIIKDETIPPVEQLNLLLDMGYDLDDIFEMIRDLDDNDKSVIWDRIHG